MTAPQNRPYWRRIDGVAVRLALVVSLALLPMGLFVVLQSLTDWPFAATVPGDHRVVPVALVVALLWSSTLIVAWVAAEILVTGHIRQLHAALMAFAEGTRKVDSPSLRTAPRELRETAEAFQKIADGMLQDQARLADALRQKAALLREVHHRVKNNLQLIASIVNIQLRHTQSQEARHALISLQDRMHGLASIHDRIYQAADLSEVSVHRLFPSIVDQILRGARTFEKGLQVETSFDAQDLPLDQAVLLALLLTEAVSHAVGQLAAVDGAAPVLRLSFQRRDDDAVVLDITNTAPATFETEVTGDLGQGIGTQLLQGFVSQLGGTFDRTITDGICRVTIQLPATAHPSGD